jgi:tetratricopeptide (TPR) repeat protein
LSQFSSGFLHGRENSTLLYKQASVKALQGNHDEAIIIFKRLVEVSPYYSLAHYGLGKIYLYKKGHIKDAIKELKLAAKYDRKHAPTYFYLGIALMFDKKYTHAIHAFSKAYKYDNSNLESMYNIGAVFDIMEDSFNAQKYFTIYYKQLDIKRTKSAGVTE